MYIGIHISWLMVFLPYAVYQLSLSKPQRIVSEPSIHRHLNILKLACITLLNI